MKKLLALILGLSMMLGIAACGKKVEVPSKSDVKKAAAEEYDMEFSVDSEDVADDEKTAEWVLVSKDGTLEVTVTWDAKKPEDFEFDDKEIGEPTTDTTESETTTTTEATTTTTEETTTTADTADSSAANTDDSTAATNPNPTGAKYVNFADMSFYIKGKKYTLGKTTLQDLIDDGVPFQDGELDDAKNNLKSHYQSSYIKLDPGTKDCYVWIEVFNDSDKGKPMNECYINEIMFKIVNDAGKNQTFVSFDFPISLTIEELKANAGEPTEKPYHNEDNPKYIYDTLAWTQKGKKFMNRNRIEFEFRNNELREFTMFYIP